MVSLGESARWITRTYFAEWIIKSFLRLTSVCRSILGKIHHLDGPWSTHRSHSIHRSFSKMEAAIFDLQIESCVTRSVHSAANDRSSARKWHKLVHPWMEIKTRSRHLATKIPFSLIRKVFGCFYTPQLHPLSMWLRYRNIPVSVPGSVGTKTWILWL